MTKSFFIIPMLAMFISSAHASINIMAYYECLWWSPQQMLGLDPNRPPDKHSRVRIAKWEYSDPIGVPHPDDVFLVIPISKSLAGRIVVTAFWKAGKRSFSEQVYSGIIQNSAQEKTVRALIHAQPTIDQISPTELVSVVTLDGQEIARKALPIQLGD